jgi:hypothetical protein
MSRSKNQHDKAWNPPNRFLKEATKSKRRSAEKRYLKKLNLDPSYYDEADVEDEKELEDIWNWE